MNYEQQDPDPYPDAVQIDGHAGVAWYVLGLETVPDVDTEWTGTEAQTGNLVCVMVGDDRHWAFDPDDVRTLARADYCGECGQIGCGHDGMDRDEV